MPKSNQALKEEFSALMHEYLGFEVVYSRRGTKAQWEWRIAEIKKAIFYAKIRLHILGKLKQRYGEVWWFTQPDTRLIPLMDRVYRLMCDHYFNSEMPRKKIAAIVGE